MAEDHASNEPARARAALAELLAEQAQGALEQARPEEAIRHWAASLQLQPGRMEWLRDMAAAWQALGDEEAALLCHRNTVPPALDRSCYLADLTEQRMRPPAACPGVQHHAGFDEQPLALGLPPCNVALEPFGQFRRRSTAPASAFTSVVHDGELWFDRFNVMLLNAERQIVGHQARGNPSLVMAALATRAPSRLTGTTCFIDARSGSNYYHWMLDIVPKLAVLEAAGLRVDEVDHWLVRQGRSFQDETLARLGIDPAKVLGIGAETHVRCERLIVPRLKNDVGERPGTALGFGMGQWLPAWLKERFLAPSVVPATADDGSSVSARAESVRRRLFISRAAGVGRQIHDEAALEALLAQRGFERIEPERLSVAEQARLMSEAEVVLAAHGAALANIAFCRPGTLVLEVFGRYVVPCYWALAGIASLDYACFMAGQGGREGALARAANEAEDRLSALHVPNEQLATWLDERLESRPIRGIRATDPL